MQGFIFAGGMSSRMGVPKAGLMLGGRSFLELAAAALSTVAGDDISVVGLPVGVVCGLPIAEDALIPSSGSKSGGALVGLYTALSVATSDWIAIIGCDTPFASCELFDELNAVDRTGFDAIVPTDQDARLQPLCALYRRATCLQLSGNTLANVDRSMNAFLKPLRTHIVSFNVLIHIAGADRLFFNVNSPDDFRQAREML